MAMTDTRPSPSAPADAPGPAAAPAESPGLAGWFTTSDHKRVGRLWIATSLLFLAVGGIAGAVLGLERMGDGLDILSSGTFGQVYTFHGEVAVLLFLVPLVLGVATVVVPLQIGSPEIAFPRGAATAYWTHLVSAGLLVGAYLADGGPSGDSASAVDLYLLALLGLLASAGLGAVCLLTTIVTMRTAGMTLERTPAFTWSILVGGSLMLLTGPVLVARLIEAYIGSHFGGAIGSYDHLSWFWSLPQVYLLAVPAAGVALEIVPVVARRALRVPAAALVVIGLLGVAGIGAWAQVEETFDDLLYVGLAFFAVLPAFALLGLVGDTLRPGHDGDSASTVGRGTPSRAALAFAVGAVLSLLLGALAGALSSIDALDLRGTTWDAGQSHLVLFGAGTLGAFAALWWWAPKLWGARLSEPLGLLAFGASFLGAMALVVPDLVNGLADDVRLRSRSFDGDVAGALNAVSAIGGVLVVGGAILVLLAVLAVAFRRAAATPADPWGGHTLEWTTDSPPAPANFGSVIPPVTSATPLLDSNSEVSA